MKIVIWGSKTDAVRTYEALYQYHEIKGFGENNIKYVGDTVSGQQVLSCFKVKALYCQNTIEAVVIPGTYSEKSIKEIMKTLKEMEICEKDIYLLPFNAVKECRNELVKWEDLVQLYSLNVKVAEHCNLNCRRCNNFSNIIKESFYGIEQYENDIKRLKELIENISCIKLIGGEPLLNKNIEKFIIITKKYYPYARINIVTNGTLILQLDKKVLEAMKENDVHIQITLYPALQVKIDDIMGWIKKNEVKCEIFRDGDAFGSFINMKGDNDRSLVEGKEFYGKCVSMFNGLICRCGPGMTIEKFNHKFKTNLPNNGQIDLYRKDLNGKKLIDLLNQSIDLCAYCDACLPMGDRQIHKWEKCDTSESKLDDYIIK